jgi:hypothetical protein
MNISDSCHRFFGADRALVLGYGSNCVGSPIYGQEKIGCWGDRPKTQHQAALFVEKTELLKTAKSLSRAANINVISPKSILRD